MATIRFYGWKLLGAYWLVLFCVLGWPPYGSGFITRAMGEQLGFDRELIGWPHSVLMLASGLPAPLIALLVARKGIRFTLITGALLMLAGSLFMALVASSIWAAIFGAGLIGLGVVTGGALPVQTSTMRWFVRHRALAFAIILSAGGIGGVFAQPVLNYAISRTGDWRAGWWIFAAFAALAAVTALLFARDQPADLGQQADGGPGAAPAASVETKRIVHHTDEPWTSREAVRSPTLWLLLLCTCGVSMGCTWFLSAHGTAHLQDLGHSTSVAAFTASLMAATTLLGKFAVGSLGDRVEPRYLFAAAVGVFGVGILMIATARDPVALYAYGVCLGIGWGGTLTCLMTILANYYGPKAYPAAVGVALFVQPPVSAISPALAGYLFKVYGSYAPMLYTFAAMCFVSALLLTRARPPVRPAPRTAGEVVHPG